MNKIKKDDLVQIMLGKDRGKNGKVLRVIPKTGRVLIDGINTFKRHVKRSGQNPGGIIELNKSLNITNVLVVCPKCKKATRIGFKIDGKTKSRVCKKCQAVI